MNRYQCAAILVFVASALLPPLFAILALRWFARSTAIDRLAARLAIWALRRLFDCCEPPHEPECLGCKTAEMTAALRDVLE